jgi:hypothetical protein
MSENKELISVRIDLRPEDEQFVENLRKAFGVKSKASAVSLSLELMNMIINTMDNHADLLVRKNNNKYFKIKVPGLDYAVS